MLAQGTQIYSVKSFLSSTIDLATPLPHLTLTAALPLWLHSFLCHGLHCNIYVWFTAHSSSIYNASRFVLRESADQLMIGVEKKLVSKRKISLDPVKTAQK